MATSFLCGALALIVLLASSAAGRADDSVPANGTGGLELFAAFKRFCVDTGASPDAMKAAVEAAGGTFKTQGDTGDGLVFMTVTSWNYVADGQYFIISAGTMRVSAFADQPRKYSRECTIFTSGDVDASVAAIREWVGVPSFSVSNEATGYYFQVLGSARLRMDPSNDATRTAKSEGRERLLVVIQKPHWASVQLNAYFYGASPTP